MRLTADLLEQRGACGEGLEYFKKNFPNGATLLEVLERKDLPASYIHWGVTALGFNNDPVIAEKEVAAYNERLHLENSTSVFHSYRVRDSHIVSHSHVVDASQYVFSSDKVKRSEDVCGSSLVEDSEGVYNSKFVYGSKEVLFSTNVTGSSNIINTNYAVTCDNILDSTMVTRVRDSRRCYNVNDSAFCINMDESRYCLFCSDCRGRQYEIFNKPVSEEMFEFIMKQYNDIMPEHLPYAEPYVHGLMLQQIPKVHYDIRKYYTALTENKDVMEWITSLPNFSSSMWYGMTFCPVP